MGALRIEERIDVNIKTMVSMDCSLLTFAFSRGFRIALKLGACPFPVYDLGTAPLGPDLL